MNIKIGSTWSAPCNHITISSIGDSKSVHDGMYEYWIFGTYSFVSTDARGNNMYHANIQGTDRFITKNMYNYWLVNMTTLYKFKNMV